jgi:hypothetical protein
MRRRRAVVALPDRENETMTITTRTEHLARTGLILVLTLAIGAAWIWAPLEPEMRARFEGVLLLLAPALLDSLNVARRQRADAVIVDGGAS